LSKNPHASYFDRVDMNWLMNGLVDGMFCFAVRIRTSDCLECLNWTYEKQWYRLWIMISNAHRTIVVDVCILFFIWLGSFWNASFSFLRMIRVDQLNRQIIRFLEMRGAGNFTWAGDCIFINLFDTSYFIASCSLLFHSLCCSSSSSINQSWTINLLQI
jgi:hypothetical protein